MTVDTSFHERVIEAAGLLQPGVGLLARGLALAVIQVGIAGLAVVRAGRSDEFPRALEVAVLPEDGRLQRPQERNNDMTTWSPTCTLETPGPISSTTPAASWPATSGSAADQSPRI